MKSVLLAATFACLCPCGSGSAQGIDPDWLVPAGVVKPTGPVLDSILTSTLTKYDSVMILGGSAPLGKTYSQGVPVTTFSVDNCNGGDDPKQIAIFEFGHFTDLNGSEISALGLTTVGGDKIALNGEYLGNDLFKSEDGGNAPVTQDLLDVVNANALRGLIHEAAHTLFNEGLDGFEDCKNCLNTESTGPLGDELVRTCSEQFAIFTAAESLCDEANARDVNNEFVHTQKEREELQDASDEEVAYCNSLPFTCQEFENFAMMNIPNCANECSGGIPKPCGEMPEACPEDCELEAQEESQG